MHRFDQDIAFATESPGRLVGAVSGNWSINGNPNGGYLLALAAGAMLGACDKEATPILTASFISRCQPGDAEIALSEIVRSRQFCRMEARLIQGKDEKVRAIGTFMDPADNCFIKRYEAPPPTIAPRDTCIPIPQLPKFTLYDHMEVRLDPDCAGWMENRLTDRSEHKGWITFKDERPYDICALALVADAFPPAVFVSQGMMAWVPTIELSVNIRNIPRTRWLKCVFRTRFINCGLLEEDGEIWDEADELVAISRQIALFRQATG